MNVSSQKSSEQYMVQKIILTGPRHDEFRKILLKFDITYPK